MPNSRKGISHSRFAMWRSVVVMIHADNVVTPQELCFINDYIKDMDLSDSQIETIAHDLKVPKNAQEIFGQIKEEQDKKDFFALARAVAWCDGNFVDQERRILDLLEDQYMTGENMSYLQESREIMNEVELRQDEWNFSTDRSKSLLGFLTNRKFKTA